MSDRTVFLSYRPDDADLIEPLKKALEAAQLNVIDFQSAEAAGLEEAISKAALFVIAAPMTSELAEAAANDAEIQRLLAPRKGGGKLISKTEIGAVEAKNARVKGVVADDISGDVSTTLKVETFTIDEHLSITGTDLGKRRGNRS